MRSLLCVLEAMFPGTDIRRRFLRATKKFAHHQLEAGVLTPRLRALVRSELERVIADARAFGDDIAGLLDRYRPLVRRIARRTARKDTRPECEQEVLLDLFRVHRRVASGERTCPLPTFYAKGGPFAAYVTKCTRIAAKRLRKLAAGQGTAWPHDPADLQAAADHRNLHGSEDPRRAFKARLFWAKVRALPPNQRRVVELRLDHFLEEQSFLSSRKIVALLGDPGLTEGAVDQRYSKARRTLKGFGIDLGKLRRFIGGSNERSNRRSIPSLTSLSTRTRITKDMEA
jgi:DNA-directed RNA polymerase specialized sigma24 family protein